MSNALHCRDKSIDGVASRAAEKCVTAARNFTARAPSKKAMHDPLTNLDSGSNCGSAALALTALFDGEASDAQARQARLHLVVCPQCAQMWRAWQSARSLLQTPVTVPPGLRLRILFACRLAALKNMRNPKVRRNSGVLLAPPSSLHAAILQRTTQLETSQAQRVSIRHTAVRYAAASAVPATLLWLALLSPERNAAPLAGDTRAAQIAIVQPRLVRARRPMRRIAPSRAASRVAVIPHIVPDRVEPPVDNMRKPQVVAPTISRVDWNSAQNQARNDGRQSAESQSVESALAARPPVQPIAARPILITAATRPAIRVVLPHITTAKVMPDAGPTLSVSRGRTGRTSRSAPMAMTVAFSPMSSGFGEPALREAAARENRETDEEREPSGDDGTSLRDLAATRPAVVRDVLDNFRASILDDSDDSASES